MGWLISLLIALAIPAFIIVSIVRRLKQISNRFSDPARLQQAFAESAAAALRRAGADPRTVAKLEVLGQEPAVDRSADLRVKAYEARIGLQRKGRYAVSTDAPSAAADPIVPSAPAPISAIEVIEAKPTARPVGELHRTPRSRRPTSQPEPVSFEMGDRFRLSVPPETGEPHGPMPFSANWLALAALIGAVAYYWVR